MEDEQKD